MQDCKRLNKYERGTWTQGLSADSDSPTWHPQPASRSKPALVGRFAACPNEHVEVHVGPQGPEQVRVVVGGAKALG